MIMAIKIGHASIDERGKIAGGKTGDQTGKEICVRNWYSKPWNVYLECTDKPLADKAATIMECICADDNYGYDQGQRLTGYNNIVKNNGKVHGAKGEFDCSSLVAACYRLAGLNVSHACTTRSLRVALVETGKFKAYTSKDYISTDAKAKRGGIYLAEGSHVVMALEDGGQEKNPYPEPKRTIYYDTANKKVVCRGDDVKWVQFELGIEVDGSCGPATDKAIRAFQQKNGLTVDGRCGPATRLKMKK